MRFNKLIPELVVKNMKKSLYFYTVILGFKLEYSREKFSFLSFQGSQIMLSENNSWLTGKLSKPYGRGINFQILVRNIKPLINNLKKYHYPKFKNLKISWYSTGKISFGYNEFLIKDIDGYLLRFSRQIGKRKVI